jgi:hypothetical protein
MIISNIEGLGKWSISEIEVKCDNCSIEKKLKFKLYTSYGYSNGEYLCKKCKLRKNNLEKWGVENVFQLDSVKEKSKKTNLEKRGVQFVTQSDEVKEKVKSSISKLDKVEINNKRKKTTLEKWGVENVSKLKNKINSQKLNISNFKRTKSLKRFNFFQISIKYSLSGLEKKLFEFIKSIYTGEIIQNFRIERNEIDIYLPDLKLGFEFNGVYWHSSEYKEKNFHANKSKFFGQNGIRLIHIWEDDWIDKSEIVKSQISNLLGLSKKIFARKCKVVEIVETKLVKEFLNHNHIQGWVNSKIKLGLFFEEKLVSIMTFDSFEGRNKMSEGEYNLNRFCNILDSTIVGGASKLLNYFVEKYKPKRIISYADRDWSLGNLYHKLGFEKVSESDADYKYVVEGKRIHKSNFRKSKTGKSESELDLPKIWDCGKIKWEKRYDINERN